jgi:uncharacterized protein
MADRISWFEIVGRDGARLRSFYSQLFGWKIDASNEMEYGLVSEEDAGIGGGIGPDPEGGPGYATVYVGVDDIGASMARVQQLGGKTIMAPTELPDLGVTIALFEDPEGHVIGMTQNTER